METQLEQYVSHCQESRYEDAKQLASTLKCPETLLKRYAVDHLIRSVPSSLCLVEELYSQLAQGDYTVSANVIKPHKLCDRLLAYTVLCHEITSQQPRTLEVWLTLHFNSGLYDLTNLIGYLCSLWPGCRRTLLDYHDSIVHALKALGLHGLVNARNNEFVELREAAGRELTAFKQHVKDLEGEFRRILQVTDGHTSPSSHPPDPVQFSHQRLVNFRLNEVHDRLKKNECVADYLNAAINSEEISSLLKVVSSRVQHDRTALRTYSTFARMSRKLCSSTVNRNIDADSKSVEAMLGEDPVMFDYLLKYLKAIDWMLDVAPPSPAVLPVAESRILPESQRVVPDSRTTCETDSGFENMSGSGETLDRLPLFDKSTSSRIPSRYLLNPLLKKQQFRSQPTLKRREMPISSGSSGRPNSPQGNGVPKKLTNIRSATSQGNLSNTSTTSYPYPGYTAYPNKNATQLKIELDHLQCQLSAADKASWKTSQKRLVNGPAQTVYDTVNADTTELVESYQSLYLEGRTKCLAALDQLQLAFRTVSDAAQNVEDNTVASIGEGYVYTDPTSAASDKDLTPVKAAVRHYLRTKAAKAAYIEETKAVMSQIWQTLYDFPSIQSCNRFHAFVQQCVQVSWDLVAYRPSFNLDFESSIFSGQLHVRHESADSKSYAIAKHIWPALIDSASKRCFCPGVVLT